MTELHDDVPLDGCVVHVMTRDDHPDTFPEDAIMSMRYLREGSQLVLMQYMSTDRFLLGSNDLEQHHRWACDPTSCARAVMRHKRLNSDTPPTQKLTTV